MSTKTDDSGNGEGMINMEKIIGTAYKSVMQELEYVPLNQR